RGEYIRKERAPSLPQHRHVNQALTRTTPTAGAPGVSDCGTHSPRTDSKPWFDSRPRRSYGGRPRSRTMGGFAAAARWRTCPRRSCPATMARARRETDWRRNRRGAHPRKAPGSFVLQRLGHTHPRHAVRVVADRTAPRATAKGGALRTASPHHAEAARRLLSRSGHGSAHAR